MKKLLLLLILAVALLLAFAAPALADGVINVGAGSCWSLYDSSDTATIVGTSTIQLYQYAAVGSGLSGSYLLKDQNGVFFSSILTWSTAGYHSGTFTGSGTRLGVRVRCYNAWQDGSHKLGWTYVHVYD